MNEKPLIRVVDDDQSVCDALSYMLSMEGWEVKTFLNASDFLRGDIPSRKGVVILDVRMPGMTGLLLQEELVKREYSHPLIFLSGHGDIAMAVSTIKKGAANFLQKPVNTIELVKVLRECLEADQKVGEVSENEIVKLMSTLTPREQQVVKNLLEGQTNAEIAGRYQISIRTIEHHREAVYRKVGVNSIDQLKKKFRRYKMGF